MSHTLQQPPCPHHPLLPSGPISQGQWLPPLQLLPGNQWGTHGPYLWASCGKGSLPSLMVRWLLFWGRGSQPIPAVLGPALWTLSLPHTDHCTGMLKGLGPLSSLVASVAVTLTDLQESIQGRRAGQLRIVLEL